MADVPSPPPLNLVPVSTSFATHQTLVLNADYRPLGFPLLTLNAPDAINAVMLERVSVVKYSNVIAHSPSTAFRLPSVVALKQYLYVPGMHETPAFTRHNLFVRDLGHCMYTGKKLKLSGKDKHQTATIDHVIPSSKGGKNDWSNCVLSSLQANTQKGNQNLKDCGLNLIHQPWTPTTADLLHLWLTEDRLQHMDEDWLEFIAPQPSARVLEFRAKLQAAA